MLATVLDASEQRGLPCSAGPDERHELARPYVEIDVIEGTRLGQRLKSSQARITLAVRP